MAEFQNFNQIWDKKMAEFEQKAVDLEEALKERHQSELGEFIQRLQNDAPKRPKFSKDLLNLRQIEATLAKQKQYAEAHKVKLKADNLVRGGG